MKKKYSLIILKVMIISFVVLGLGMCINTIIAASNSNASKSTVFALYNKVKINMTKKQVDGVLGTPSKQTDMGMITYNYMDKKHIYGVGVMYDDKNLVTAKTVIYKTNKDIAPFCKKSVSKVQKKKIKQGMTYAQVKAILGCDGVEVNATVLPFANNKIAYMYRWVNKNGSGIQLVLGADGNVCNGTMYFDE